MVQGLTAWHLLRASTHLSPGTHDAGTLRPVVGGTCRLSEARRAHEDLRSRASRGKLVLDCTA